MFDWWHYYNAGLEIYNEKHRGFANKVIDFYNHNKENLMEVERAFHCGTVQTPVNFLIHLEKIPLSKPFLANVQSKNIDIKHMISNGDDYQIIFTSKNYTLTGRASLNILFLIFFKLSLFNILFIAVNSFK